MFSDNECKLPTDVLLRSSDGREFGAHTHNLEVFSNSAFLLAEHTVRPMTEVVQLSETSEVLSLLLKFMHHKQQPDCSKIDFAILLGLAEAVDKYGVYSASELCVTLLWYVQLSHKENLKSSSVFVKIETPSHFTPTKSSFTRLNTVMMGCGIPLRCTRWACPWTEY